MLFRAILAYKIDTSGEEFVIMQVFLSKTLIIAINILQLKYLRLTIIPHKHNIMPILRR